MGDFQRKMKCPKCQTENKENVTQCKKCGTKLIIESPKNKYYALGISIVLGFFTLCGAGQLYLNQFKRAAIEIIIGLVSYGLTLLGGYVSEIFNLVLVIWYIYTCYDTYKCAEAINEDKPLPKLLGTNIQ